MAKKNADTRDRFITRDYPEVIAQETAFSMFWHVCTLAFFVLLLFWPRSIALWIGFCFFALISVTLLLVVRGKPIPVIAVPLLVGINNLFDESEEDNRHFAEVQEYENRFGIVNESSIRKEEEEALRDYDDGGDFDDYEDEAYEPDDYYDEDDDDEEVWKK